MLTVFQQIRTIQEEMPPVEKPDFVKAATTLSGSQDVGAQLFCALLRCVGVEARLVCSLQPLPFGTSGAKSTTPIRTKPTVYAGSDKDNTSAGETSAGSASEGSTSSRRRIIAPGRIRRMGNASLNAGPSTPGSKPPGKQSKGSDKTSVLMIQQSERRSAQFVSSTIRCTGWKLSTKPTKNGWLWMP
jgi:xeroderma pigmentosum group C-complementing protein